MVVSKTKYSGDYSFIFLNKIRRVSIQAGGDRQGNQGAECGRLGERLRNVVTRRKAEIVNIDDAVENNSCVLTFGHFSTIHPGHIASESGKK